MRKTDSKNKLVSIVISSLQNVKGFIIISSVITRTLHSKSIWFSKLFFFNR